MNCITLIVCFETLTQRRWEEVCYELTYKIKEWTGFLRISSFC